MASTPSENRRAEFELAASHAKLGLWECDETGTSFVASDTVCEILGLAATETELATVAQLYAEDSAKFQRAIEQARVAGTRFSLVSEIATPSGKRKWVRTQGQASTAMATGGRTVFGTVQDISELRLLDTIAQQSELTLNQVEQITHIGHWSVSLTDGSFFHSDEIKRIFGYEPSEYALSVEDAINAYHPDDRSEVIRLFNRAVETGQGYEFDLRVVQPTGDIRHVHSKGYAQQDVSGKVTRVYGVFQDITQQVEAQQALRASEASIKALVDSVHTAIVVHDKDGAILLSNQMANRLLAPLATDVVGRELEDPAWRFVFEDGREVSVEELPVSQVLATGAPLENLVLGRRDPNGTAWLLINGVPVHDAQGQLAKVIISFVDITEHRQMEERLNQSEKMKAIGLLAGGVAHDFNNQLNVMVNFAELLADALPEGSPEHTWATEIHSSATRAADLTKQLLAFARKGKYVVKAVDLNRLIAEVVSIASRSFDKRIRITHRAYANPAIIAGDASQLQNALLNLALNSRDAMPDGGELEFTTRRVTLDEARLKSVGLGSESLEYLQLTVRDTGSGMDPVTQKRVFEPFFSTKAPGKGTGMGMASVYGTVHNHHGAIQVESELGTGTTITLLFPLVEASMTEQPHNPEVQRQGGGRVLIIDDEPSVSRSLSAMLQRKGFHTTACAGGREGVKRFEDAWQETDVVLLDMNMPDMSGPETLQALRAVNPAVKVILMSGFSLADETGRRDTDGIAGFLEKPIALKVLVDAVTDTIRNKA